MNQEQYTELVENILQKNFSEAKEMFYQIMEDRKQQKIDLQEELVGTNLINEDDEDEFDDYDFDDDEEYDLDESFDEDDFDIDESYTSKRSRAYAPGVLSKKSRPMSRDGQEVLQKALQGVADFNKKHKGKYGPPISRTSRSPSYGLKLRKVGKYHVVSGYVDGQRQKRKHKVFGNKGDAEFWMFKQHARNHSRSFRDSPVIGQ